MLDRGQAISGFNYTCAEIIRNSHAAPAAEEVLEITPPRCRIPHIDSTGGLSLHELAGRTHRLINRNPMSDSERVVASLGSRDIEPSVQRTRVHNSICAIAKQSDFSQDTIGFSLVEEGFE